MASATAGSLHVVNLDTYIIPPIAVVFLNMSDGEYNIGNSCSYAGKRMPVSLGLLSRTCTSASALAPLRASSTNSDLEFTLQKYGYCRLENTVQALVAEGKCILAADETPQTLTKRFEALKINSTSDDAHFHRS